MAHGVAERISASTVWRWLAREVIKLWQYRSWLFPRDPDFATKAEREPFIDRHGHSGATTNRQDTLRPAPSSSWH